MIIMIYLSNIKNVYIKLESLATAHLNPSLTLAVNLCVVSGPNTIVCKLKKKGEE